MCGIAAVFKSRVPLERVKLMLSLLRHRGDISDPPLKIGEASAMGTERLRIVDFAFGCQPATSWNGEWLVVFNGEIYNHETLRSILRRKGILCRTRSDTEVLVNWIATRGTRGIAELDGIFAFVAVHRDGVRWIAARDPMGVKPLYFVKEGDTTLFASEIYPLLRVTSNSPVEVFQPGTWLSETGNGFVECRSGEQVKTTLLTGQNAWILKQLIEEAVAKQIPPDLPCTVLFSGGIDSTLIAHIARRKRSDISLSYIGSPSGSDFQFAKLYSEHFATNLDITSYNEKEVLALVPEVVRVTETFEPNVIRAGCFSYLISRALGERGYRVALSGEGADELFCGYPQLAQTVVAMSSSEAAVQIRSRRRRYLSYLERTQLQRVDRCGMRHGLEVRVPFLDKYIVEFSETLPIEQMVLENDCRLSTNKIVLREVYKYFPEIPEGFARRNKIAFIQGTGMGTNAPNGPFYDFAISNNEKLADSMRQEALGRLIDDPEAAFYYRLLQKTHDTERMPFLKDRPFAS